MLTAAISSLPTASSSQPAEAATTGYWSANFSTLLGPVCLSWHHPRSPNLGSIGQLQIAQASLTHAAATQAKPPAKIIDSVHVAPTAAHANTAPPPTHLRSGDTLSVDGLVKVTSFAAAPGLFTQVSDVLPDQLQQLLQQLKSQGLYIAPSGVAGNSGAGLFAARDLRTTLSMPKGPLLP
eukprot:SAG25_NODE_386_length_8683_cov_36.568150_3_plen_180_part_00